MIQHKNFFEKDKLKTIAKSFLMLALFLVYLSPLGIQAMENHADNEDDEVRENLRRQLCALF